MIHRRTLLALAVAMPFTSTSSLARPATARTPEALIDWIYKEAIKPESKTIKGPQGGGFLFEEGEMKASFSRAFHAAYVKAHAEAKEEDGPIIGFDPVTNSQDPDFARFRVELEKGDDKTAVFAVSLWTKKGRKPYTTVRYDMVLEGGIWKIDDIRGSVENEPWSIRELVKTP